MRKGRIFFITRTWNKKSGGGIMRYYQVQYMRNLGWEVTVVGVKNNLNEPEDGVILIDNPINLKLGLILEHIGLINDYLSFWKKKALKILKDIIEDKDVIIATTGGEFATIELGNDLKQMTGCKLVYYFRDPIDFTTVNGQVVPHRFFHVKRDRLERRIIANADLILTVSKTMKNEFLKKYPFIPQNRIRVIYTGYPTDINIDESRRNSREKFVIIYSGRVAIYQRPNILFHALELLDSKIKSKIEFHVIGNFENYEKRDFKDLNVKFFSFMPRSKFIEYATANADIAFLSLYGEYFTDAIPSKFYEYINLELPILAAIPKGGELYELINKKGYGIAVHYNDIQNLTKGLERLITDMRYYRSCVENIRRDKSQWSMKHNIKILNGYLREIRG